MTQFSHSRFLTLARQSCVIFLIGLFSGASVYAQCSFNRPLDYDASLFPNFPNGTDGNSYASESAAFAAAKLAFYGPSGSYQVPTAADVCKGRRISMDLSMVKRGGAGDIIPSDSVIYPLSVFAGKYFLVVNAVRGFCAGNVIVSTGVEIYPLSHVLSCDAPALLQLALTGPTETRPAGTGGTSEVTLTAKVADGSSPKPGVALSFTTEVTANSGGHDHNEASRPKGTLSLSQGTTDANGEVKFTFKAAEVAGIHTVKANCASCSNPVVGKEIQVKVPNLVEMLPDTATPVAYKLVGYTEDHKSNHWFTSASTAILYKVVDAMYKTGWGQVGINDGSLKWGGVFDIKRTWKPPSHTGHNIGTEVDVSFNNPNLITEAQKNKSYADLCKQNNTSFSVQTLWHQDDGYPPHFHLYLNGVGLTSQAAGGACCTSYKTTRAKKDKAGNPVFKKDGISPVTETVSLCTETSPR